MAYLIGTDEAGYGPNLGPLTISCSVWQLPDRLSTTDLYPLLGEAVSREPLSGTESARVVIADSKTLYRSGGTLRSLEAGLFPVLAALGPPPTSWQAVWHQLAPQSRQPISEIAWYADFDCPLPLAVDRSRIDDLASSLRRALQRRDVHLRMVRSVAVFPAQFNRLLDSTGSKGTVLSTLTVELVRQVLTQLGEETVLIQCDKHGGRSRYGPLLQTAFPEYLVEKRQESRSQSVYRWGPAARRVEIRFVAKGERFLPAALASMTSKYLRELAMMAFNQFWQKRVPGLRPTAGYPVDAARFRREIAAEQQRWGIPDSILWRKR